MKSKWFLVAISLVVTAMFLSSCSNSPSVQSYPVNGTTVPSSSVTLQWNVNVPQNVSVTYSLYFGNDKNPSLAATGLTQQQYTVKGLRVNVPYYWKVVGRDDQGDVVTGPLWQFSFVRGTVVEETFGFTQTLDPMMINDSSSKETAWQLYENLLQYEGTSTKKIFPMLSTNVPSEKDGTILDNGTTYVFRIRKNVYFHNHQTLTPEDVVYSLERAVIIGRSSWMLARALLPRIDGNYVESITAWAVKLGGVKSYSDLFKPGTTTPKNEQAKQALVGAFKLLSKDFEIKGNDVIIHLPAPYSPILSILTHGMPITSIMDKNWAVKNGAWPGTADTWWKYRNPSLNDDPLNSIENGTGPFTLDKWTKNDEITFKRFADYWRKPAEIGYGVIKTVRNFSTAKSDLLDGKAQVMYVPTQDLDQFENAKGISVTKDLPAFVIDSVFFTWNVRGDKYIGSGKLDGNGIPPEFFSDKDVRLGFEYLFPYSDYVKQEWKGQALVPNGAIPKGMLGYDAATPAAFRQDLSKAEYYFKKAYNGVLWDKGFKFTAVFNTGNARRHYVLEMLKNYAAEINPKFVINVASEEWGNVFKDLNDGKIPMYSMGWMVGDPDPYDFVQAYYSSTGNFGATLGASYVAWAKKNMDPLIEKSIEITDPQERAQIYAELNSIAQKNGLFIWVDQPFDHHVQRTAVKGWSYNPARYGLNFYSLHY